RDVEVQPFGAAGLDITVRSHSLQHVPNNEGSPKSVTELRAGSRIEVEVEVVRLVYVVAAGVPLVQIDAAEVHYPEQGRDVIDDGEVDHVGRCVLHGADVEPFRVVRGRVFHKEEVAGRAVGVALHDHR